MGCYGHRGVAERFKAAALETVVCAKHTVDSNLTPSASNPLAIPIFSCRLGAMGACATG